MALTGCVHCFICCGNITIIVVMRGSSLHQSTQGHTLRHECFSLLFSGCVPVHNVMFGRQWLLIVIRQGVISSLGSVCLHIFCAKAPLENPTQAQICVIMIHKTNSKPVLCRNLLLWHSSECADVRLIVVTVYFHNYNCSNVFVFTLS